MEQYTINFTFSFDYFSITVIPNYIFDVASGEDSEKIAWEIAGDLEGKMSDCIKVYYAVDTNEMVIEIKENDYFNQVTISKYTFYDEVKFPLISITFEDGMCLYPVLDENGYIDMSKESFNELLLNRFKKDTLFDGINYGISRISTTL